MAKSLDEVDNNAMWLEAVGEKSKKGCIFRAGLEVLEIGCSSTLVSSTPSSLLYLDFDSKL